MRAMSKGFVSDGFGPGRRAYVVNRENGTPNGKLSLRLVASPDSPVYNPAIIVNNWDQESLTLNGKEN